MPLNQTGLLIIRAWTEHGSSKLLRAHVRFTTDVTAGFTSEVTLADLGAVSATVETWLRDVLSRAGAPLDNGSDN